MDITTLLEGDTATIEDCNNIRLSEHGFVKGTEVYIYKKIQNITCVYIRGAVIACRNYDLEKVCIKDNDQ